MIQWFIFSMKKDVVSIIFSVKKHVEGSQKKKKKKKKLILSWNIFKVL